MIGLTYDSAVLVDTSAAVALVDEKDAFHAEAWTCLEQLKDNAILCAVDVTAHESFTRLRYSCDLDAAESGFSLVRGVRLLPFQDADEKQALALVRKYADKSLSFHDALCGAVMLRNQMFRIFSFDSDFWTFGFEIVPGRTRTK